MEPIKSTFEAYFDLFFNDNPTFTRKSVSTHIGRSLLLKLTWQMEAFLRFSLLKNRVKNRISPYKSLRVT